MCRLPNVPLHLFITETTDLSSPELIQGCEEADKRKPGFQVCFEHLIAGDSINVPKGLSLHSILSEVKVKRIGEFYLIVSL